MLYVISLCMCSGQELIDTDPYLVNKSAGLTELPGGVLTGGRTVWKREGGPYLLRDDLLIERDAELVVEPGVEVRFAPMIGITVRGKLVAVVSFIEIFSVNSIQLGAQYLALWQSRKKISE